MAAKRTPKRGARITELRPNIDIPDLENILRDVTERLNIRERKVKGPEGREYSLRVRPYSTIDHKIDGAVITLVELGGEEVELCRENVKPREARLAAKIKDAQGATVKPRHRPGEPCANYVRT